jgi:Cdc6-like AAA superfamily ATPase
MDRYLPTPKQKNEHEITKLGPAVCILGKTGIGKTWLVHHTFERYLELTADILRSKQTTSEILN